MNSLSWFLYSIDVIGNLSFTATFALVTSVVYLAARSLFTAVFNEFNECEIALKQKAAMVYPNYSRWIIGLGILMLVGSALPSRQTMYAIAASEVGEKVIKSEAVQGLASDAQLALQAWIKSQIKPVTVEVKPVQKEK